MNDELLYEQFFQTALSDQVEQTLSKLEDKRRVLFDQHDAYSKLYEQVKDGEDQKSFTIGLGADYFVEKSVGDALVFLDEKMKLMKDSIREIEAKMGEAKSTLNSLMKFEELSKEMPESNPNKSKFNEEGLPFMEIEELLDDSDNVLGARINNEDVKFLKDEQTADSLSTTVPVINKMKREGSESFEFIQENLSSDEDKSNLHPKKESSKEQNEELSQLLDDMEISTGASLVKPDIIDQDLLLEKIDKLKISPEDKFKLKSICLDEFKKQDLQTENFLHESEKSQTKFKPDASISDKNEEGHVVLSNSIVERNALPNSNEFQASEAEISNFDDFAEPTEILELEILADEFEQLDQAQSGYNNDEDWDFEFSDEDDENDDDLADELLYGKNESFMIGDLDKDVNSRLWNQIMNLREQKSASEVSDNNRSENFEKSNKKTVRFAERLDIKEIENVSEYLKAPAPISRLSLFKQNRLREIIINGEPQTEIANDSNMSFTQSEKNECKPQSVDNHDVAIRRPSDSKIIDTIIERSGDVEPLDRYGLVERSILENEDKVQEEVQGKVQEKAKKVSRFKQAKITNSNRKDFSPEPTTNPDFGSQTINGDIIERELGLDSDSLVQSTNFAHKKFSLSNMTDRENYLTGSIQMVSDITSKRITHDVSATLHDNDQDIRVKETSMDLQSLQNDMETMAKAYVLGMYDDDIETEGPVVSELEDFEILNKMLDSMPSTMKSHSDNANTVKMSNQHRAGNNQECLNENEGSILFSENDLKEGNSIVEFQDGVDVDEDDEEDDDDEGPILLDEIVENDFEVNDELTLSREVELENDILNSEVASSYHRLKQKLFFEQSETGFRKTEQELEFEPIDENGYSIRVSRFKAAKMGR